MRSAAGVAGGRGIALVAALILPWLPGCRSEPAQTAARPALTVTTAEVASRPVPRVVSTSGTVRAWQELPVGSETSGLAVVELLVEEGDTVTRGQLLARLNDHVLVAQLAQQEAGISEARATLTEAQANLKRAETLHSQNAASAQSLDARQAAASTASARLAVAEASRAETAARLAQTRILAPDEGYVSSRTVEIGQIVASGQELFKIVRGSRLELEAEVPETELVSVRDGQHATVSADGAGEVAATVRAVAPSIDARTRLGIVHLALPPDSGFRPGMFARAEVALGDAPALVVPQGAVVWRDGKAGSFVIDAEGNARFRSVETGARFGANVEIRGGLTAGERVALEGAGFLEDGDHVRVADDPAKQEPPSELAVGVVGG
jgi:RND family efflux transporter MFP subunit